jgi:hypothetical protein
MIESWRIVKGDLLPTASRARQRVLEASATGCHRVAKRRVCHASDESGPQESRVSDAKPTERSTDAAPHHDADLLAALAEADATVAARQRRITPHHTPVGLDGHVGLRYFPLAPGAIGNRAGLLCLNRESVSQDLPDGRRTSLEEVRKEITAHRVEVLEVCRPRRSHEWQVAESRYNRQITANTPIELSGPVRGSRWVRTKYSPSGILARGTLVNGAHGVTPWGTYLACESHWAGYFVNRAAVQPREHAGYGVATSAGRRRWEDLPADECARFDATPMAGGSPEQDYRNEPNGFGWVVEIDPFAPREVPRKRTALGRLDHDRAWFEPATPGHPLVVHLGDGSARGCLYMFITRDVYRPGQTDGNCLDEGTLYVARLDAGGHLEWLALDHALPDFRDAAAARDVAFEDQADVLVNTRLAAEAVGAPLTGRRLPCP